MSLVKKILVTTIILVLLFIASFVIMIMLPARNASKHTLPECTNNLSVISEAASLYMMDNENWIKSFQDLAPDYADHPEMFICPESKTKPGEMTNIDDWSSYTLITNPALDLCVWVFCPGENHKSKLIHVLLTDGSTKEMNEEEFKQALKKQ